MAAMLSAGTQEAKGTNSVPSTDHCAVVPRATHAEPKHLLSLPSSRFILLVSLLNQERAAIVGSTPSTRQKGRGRLQPTSNSNTPSCSPAPRTRSRHRESGRSITPSVRHCHLHSTSILSASSNPPCASTSEIIIQLFPSEKLLLRTVGFDGRGGDGQKTEVFRLCARSWHICGPPPFLGPFIIDEEVLTGVSVLAVLAVPWGPEGLRDRSERREPSRLRRYQFPRWDSNRIEPVP